MVNGRSATVLYFRPAPCASRWRRVWPRRRRAAAPRRSASPPIPGCWPCCRRQPVLIARLEPSSAPLHWAAARLCGRRQARGRSSAPWRPPAATWSDFIPCLITPFLRSAHPAQLLDDRAHRLGAGLVTTEKDWVKLPSDWRARVTAWPVRVRFEDEAALDRINNALRWKATDAQIKSAVERPPANVAAMEPAGPVDPGTPRKPDRRRSARRGLARRHSAPVRRPPTVRRRRPALVPAWNTTIRTEIGFGAADRRARARRASG